MNQLRKSYCVKTTEIQSILALKRLNTLGLS